MKNLRFDAEFIKSVRGYAGVMYSGRIPSSNRTGLEEGVANGTLLNIGALEAGEREIRVATAPATNVLPCVVVRGEVNPAQYVKTDNLWGKFRIKADKPLPVAQLSVGDFVAFSEEYFATADVSAIAVGQKFVIDTVGGLVAGKQLKKAASPTEGDVVFEVVEVKDNHIPTYLMADGTLTKPYKMISVEIKIA